MKNQNIGVFSIVDENEPVPGCTISGEILPGAISFSLAEGTDISAESYPAPVIQYGLSGRTVLHDEDENTEKTVAAGDLVIKPAGRNIGVQAPEDSVYLEIALKEDNVMNQVVKAGEVFKLKELVPYQDGKIVNMDIASNDGMKFVVMAFDEGTGLSEHAAPGDAIVFALDGEAVIGYDGKEYLISSGQQFRFAKGGLHSVKANGRFKMALLLMKE